MFPERDYDNLQSKTYDLIIIGGGGYGLMLAWEAAQAGKNVLLLEKDDFGGATSYNSLRIIHGGLRYLQSFNLKRYSEFVKERAWFLEHFPGLARPLPVLMPLYQQGLVRTDIFRLAFVLDRFLTGLNKGVNFQLPDSQVLSKHDVIRRFGMVNQNGLKGGALWYDGCIPDSQLWIMEVARRAGEAGAMLLNYVQAVAVKKENRKVVGVDAKNTETGERSFFLCPISCKCSWALDP